MTRLSFRGKFRPWLTHGLLHVLFAATILSAWHLCIRLLDVPNYIFPAPLDVLKAGVQGIQNGIYPRNIAATLSALLPGYLIGVGLGILVGAIIEESRALERLLYPYLVVIQATPKIAIAPLFVLWFGYGVQSKIVIVALICFFPLLVNTITGLRSTPQERIDMVRAMSATRWQIFFYIKLPSAYSTIFAGLQVAVILALIGTLVGEFVGSDHGLGNLILATQVSLDTSGMLAVLAILAGIGLASTYTVRYFHYKVVFWERPAARRSVQAKSPPSAGGKDAVNAIAPGAGNYV